MLGKENPLCPTMMKWSTQVENKSLYNTPPAFSTYVATEVFKYLKSIGGVKAMQKINEETACLLYTSNRRPYFTGKVRLYKRGIGIPAVY